LKLSKEALSWIKVAAETGKYADIQAAVERALRENEEKKSVAKEIEEFVMTTDGYFSTTDVYKRLQLTTRKDQKTAVVNLLRLKERGLIEKFGKKAGVYRKIERECEIIDWQNAPTTEIPLKFPLNIEDYVKIYPKSIIMVAGKSDAGKSGFLLEFARMNMSKHEIHFFVNEAGDSELAVRLGLFKNMRKEDWKCTFWEREDGFADVIKPNAINIIDYLDVTEEFAKIGTPLKQIHGKLEKGIALIAIQKNPPQYNFRTGKYVSPDFGVGGAKSVGKSRLYLAVDDGQIKIVKAKNRRGKDSPNGMIRRFKIYDGHDFTPTSYWIKPFGGEDG